MAIDFEPFKNRAIERGDVVDVYRNLNRDTLSIRRKTHVQGYAQVVHLKDAKLIVGVGGRNRVRTEGVRNVHAFVRGKIDSSAAEYDAETLYAHFEREGYRRVYYNPYEVDTFVYYDTGEPIHAADDVVVVLNRVYVDAEH